MTPSEILALPPDELAAKAGELVMGWSVCREPDCDGCDHPVRQLPDNTWIVSRPDEIEESWSPAHSASDDYMVLEKVRTWDTTLQCAVRDEIEKAWAQRGWDARIDKPLEVWGCTQYRPGDYARAALIVVMGGGK